MSDRQDTPDALPHHRPDRAIGTAAEDRLDRGPFVTRLARALVRDDHKASGVVVGLTGPWGSGKSSILKLLRTEIKDKHPGAVVVRFDPWLVSGRDDLISQFFAELVDTITDVGTDNPRNRDALLDFANKLASYAKDLGPVVELFVPGAGKPVAAGAKVLERLTTRDSSLAKQKAELEDMLGGVKVPIVVLVDELDRVEDTEVRSVAQLVRAVADFPGMSYLLAYDRARVVEALGGEDKQRGAAYLEKIVQLEVRIPNTLPSELVALLDDAVKKISDQGKRILPENWSKDKRFASLRQVLVPEILRTPRDLRRVAGMFSVLVRMVEREVDWVDLLGFSALLAKAPTVVDAIQRRPENFTIDGLTPETYDWAGGRKRSPAERLAELGLTMESPEAKLLSFMFPCFAEKTLTNDPLPPGVLRTRGGLDTVLRLGPVPGTVSLAEFEGFLKLDDLGRQEELHRRAENGTAQLFHDGFAYAYPDLDDPDPVRTIGLMAGSPSPHNSVQRLPYLAIEGAARRFRRFLHRAVRRKPTLSSAIVEAVEKLLDAEQFDLTAFLLDMESHTYLLDTELAVFGKYGSLPEEATFSLNDIERLRSKFKNTLRAAQVAGTLFRSLHTLQPIFFAIRIDAWDEVCRASLSQAVAVDQTALLSFVQLWADVEEPSLEVAGRILDADVLRRRLAAIKGGGDDALYEPAVKMALEKAHQAMERSR